MNKELLVVSNYVPMWARGADPWSWLVSCRYYIALIPQENLTKHYFPPFLPRQSLTMISRPTSNSYAQVMPLPQPPI